MQAVISLLFGAVTLSSFVLAADADPEWRPRPPFAATFSIVALDPETEELGVAVQSHWFSVGALVPWAEYGVGAVATQSFVEVAYGPESLRLLRGGKSPKEALDILTKKDEQRAVRQVAIVDAKGRTAAWTGDGCIPYAGHTTGKNFSAQGNLLDSPEVWDAMASAFEKTQGRLADRLLAALDAAQSVGGDVRGMQSASILVVGPAEPGKPWTQKKIDLRVEDHASPIEELRRLVRLQQAYELANEGDDFVGQKKFDAAFSSYDKALSLDPQNDELMFWRASMYMMAGKPDAALADVRRAVELNPRWLKLLPRLSPELFPGAKTILEQLER